jgi:hypothetical protein
VCHKLTFIAEELGWYRKGELGRYRATGFGPSRTSFRAWRGGHASIPL